MKLFFYLVTTIHMSFAVSAQNSSASGNQLNGLVNDYDKVFVHTKLFADQVLAEPVLNNDELLSALVQDAHIKEKSRKVSTDFNERDSQTDLGLKWVSDATYNFSPGIAENEDVFFRSRIATGIDWVILGEGSLQRSHQSKRIFKQQIIRDSVQVNISNNSATLHAKQLLVQHIFDLHRLHILTKYQQVLQMQVAHQAKMQQFKLIGNADKVKADNQLAAIVGMVETYQYYLSEGIPDHLVQKYWDLPYTDPVLPHISLISVDALLKEEELLVQMQKDILNSRHVPGEKPSLRAKFRYNYYDNAQHTGRSFASVGASLSVPIRFGRDSKSVAYEMATYDNNLYNEKLKLKDRLLQQHKEFYLLKNKQLQLHNDIVYAEALLKNETEVYQNQNKNFAPAKYIEYVGLLVQKKLALLDVNEQLCKDYIAFQTLNGVHDNGQESKKLNYSAYSVGTTYMWKNAFQAVSNDSLIALLNKFQVNTLFVSPGTDALKIDDFLKKAKAQNIHVSRLLSENSYAVDAGGVERLQLKLQSLYGYAFSGIHLNIEPHTFADYKINIPLYTQRMNDIYQTAVQWCNSKSSTLSVSIPLNLPLQNAQYLASNNITAYIMAYDNTDQQKLLQRSEALRTALNNNYVWVLRVSDFVKQQDLLDAVTYLKANGVSKVAFYDFSNILNSF
mgnify:CR=1 FL=1